MNIMEQEMKKWLIHCDCLKDVVYSGEVAIGKINPNVVVKISFYGGASADNRYGFLVEVINKLLGKIDCVTFEFSDVTGLYTLNDGGKTKYHMWQCRGLNPEWYTSEPTDEQKAEIMKRICDYLTLYK